MVLQAMLEQPLSSEQLQQTARQRMEVIVSAAATLANSEYTRDAHQDHITAECNAVRVQFNKLLQVGLYLCVCMCMCVYMSLFILM